LPDFSLFPPVLILFDHPIGAVELSIEHGAGLVRLILRRPGERLANAGTHTPRPINKATAPVAFVTTSADDYGSLLSQGRRNGQFN
jgi:hypothetical protein